MAKIRRGGSSASTSRFASNRWGSRQLWRCGDARGAAPAFDDDAAGNLTKTTLPDGSFLVSEYDAAGRSAALEDALDYLVAVTDAAGTVTRTPTCVYNTSSRLAPETAH